MNVPFLSLRDVTAKYKEEIHEAMLRVVDSGWYLQGSENERFERDYAEYVGSRYCVGCANGLDALIWIFRAYIEMGVMSPGDEVIVPANTYIATILAITENGLVPVLCEPKYETLEIDDERIEELVTPKTKAIAIVHLYGRNAYTDKIGEICQKYNLKLVQDCAQSHGLKPPSLQGGVGGRLLDGASAHSFYPGKNLGALGDGGAVTTDDEELAKAIRALANYGSQKKYVFKYAGRNSRLDEIQAAVLDVKLKHLDEDVTLRQQVAEYYYDNIKNPLVTLPERVDDSENVYHLFPILVADGRRDELCCAENTTKTPKNYGGKSNRDRLKEYLEEKGIGTVCHYPIAPHMQECYEKAAWNVPRLSLPITERLADEELSLPMSPCLTMEQVEYVVECVNSWPPPSPSTVFLLPSVPSLSRGRNP